MAKMTVKGSDEVSLMLENLSEGARVIAAHALYEGAGVIYRHLKAAVEALPTDDGYGTENHPKAGISSVQKAGLSESLGIAPHRDNGGTIDTSVGFDGYNSVHTQRWPQGQPNPMVARSVERGTSFMRPNPFIKRAASSAKGAAVAKMEQTAKEEIEKLKK